MYRERDIHTYVCVYVLISMFIVIGMCVDFEPNATRTAPSQKTRIPLACS